LKGRLHHVVGEFRKLAWGYAEAGNSWSARSALVKSSRGSVRRDVIHRGEADPPVGVLPVTNNLLFKIEQRNVVVERQDLAKRSIED